MPARRARTGLDRENWELDIVRGELRLNDAPVPIGSRALDILAVLVKAHGELVLKDEIIDRVWLGAIVEENALQVHISEIRKALGAHRDLLKTAYGRGYRLTGTWSIRQRGVPSGQRDHPVESPAGLRTNNFPSATVDLIGRHAAVQYVIGLLSRSRLVTLIGPGGIGKTVLALKVARSLFASFDGDGFFVELASLSDPELVPSAVAGAIGLKLGAEAISAENIGTALCDRKLLLVLDNCEHLIDAAARLVDTLIRRCPQTWIVATTREILRVDGEHVYSVSPLEVPLRAQHDAATLLDLTAVQLFLARVEAREPGRTLRSDEVSAIAAICRGLDGIPLAIEFAAARASVLGVEEVARHLDERFRLLTSGRRTALPRHKTLRAALDWSYELLPEPERRSLRRLAVFAGAFSLDAAAAVLNETDSVLVAAEAIANLVGKSLVTFDGAGAHGRWRLLETIRAYALEKLAEAGESQPTRRRHAVFYRDFMAPAAISSGSHGANEDIGRFAREIDNIRGALDWAFAPDGDESVGAELTLSTVPVWVHFSMMSECRDRVEQAITTLEKTGAAANDLRIRLNIALAMSLLYGMGSPERIGEALDEALRLAELLGATDRRMRATWVAWTLRFNTGALAAARDMAEGLLRMATERCDPFQMLVGHRLLGNTLHAEGRQGEARRHFERALGTSPAPDASRDSLWHHQDQHALARAMLARVLWVQGFADQAMRHAAASVEQAKASQHELSLRFALVWAACPIALLTGHLTLAQRWVELLRASVSGSGEVFYARLGSCLEGVLLIEQGDLPAGLAMLNAGLDRFRKSGWTTCTAEFLGALSRGFGRVGELDRAHLATAEAIARCEQGGEYWFIPELLRIEGDLVLLARNDAAVSAAEALFAESLRRAREQGALAWELRSAISMVRLPRDQWRADEGRDLLAEVYGRFTEGFETADLLAARRLLDGLH